MNTPNEILQAFKSDKPRKKVFNNYRIEGNTLLYRATSSEEFTWMARKHKDQITEIFDKYKQKGFISEWSIENVIKNNPHKVTFIGHETNTIAKKIICDGKTIFLGNGSILPLIGRKMAWGNENRNNRETDIQRQMRSEKFIMVPFNVFDEAKLNINNFKPIDSGPEETFKIKEEKYDYKLQKEVTLLVDRHYVGASLFEVDGKCFLFDVDRNEIKHNIFNPFLVQLTKKVSTIKDAYESLKPKAVLDAEKKKLKIKRQGEWFFIPAKVSLPKLTKDDQFAAMIEILQTNWRTQNNEQLKYIMGKTKTKKGILDTIPAPLSLRAGNNRPNNASLGIKKGDKTFVKGTVKHAGREHADLNLSDWHEAIPNTSVGSFTITGDVD